MLVSEDDVSGERGRVDNFSKQNLDYHRSGTSETLRPDYLTEQLRMGFVQASQPSLDPSVP